jgi:molybdopterin molybdotransferase
VAQLSPDAFRRANAPATLEEVARLIAERTPVVVGTERVGLADADGRVLAENLIAPLDLPGFDNAAVDGYALAHADLNADAETQLPVEARIAAGGPGPAALRRGAAARIFTGALLPVGADTVFMQEDVRWLDDGRVALPAGLAAGANARPRGEDIARGALALSAGQRLDPRHIALAAALGQSELGVRRPVRVAVFSTGDEVASPGEPLREGAIYDSNRSALIALLRRRGCLVADYGVLRDDRAAIESRLRQAAGTSDLVITSGGVSVGEEDHVRKAIEAAGALTFWRLAIKPGRPVAMGVLDGVPIVGLPGNPVAVFIAFAFVARPLIAALGGEALRPPAPVQVECGFDYRKKAGRREFVRARLVRGAASDPIAKRHPVDGAALITSLTQTDGLVVLPETLEAVRIGDRVEFLSYEQIW